MNQAQIFKTAIQSLDAGDFLSALNALQPLVNAGHAQAILYYGDILLQSNYDKGRDFLLEYANKGLIEAYIRLAIFDVYFNGKSLDGDVSEQLQKAGEMGSVQALFILLEINWYKETKSKYWTVLSQIAPELIEDFENFLVRHGVQKENCIRTEKTNVLSADANVRVFDDVFSPVTCFYIITRFSGMMKPAEVVDPVSGKSLHHDIRSSSYCNISTELVDWFSLYIDKTLSNLLGHNPEVGEPLSLLSYSRGQTYKNHFDALPHTNDKKQWQFDGEQRVATAICYLNDDFTGGDTSFANLALSVKPKMGSVLSFENVDSEYRTLKMSYHAGEPVDDGIKWVATKWIRQSSTPYGRAVYKSRV